MATYTLISSVTVGSGGAANIEFTSIPQTYTDLLVKLSSRSDYADSTINLFFQMAGVTSSVYSSKNVIGDGSSATSGSETSRVDAARMYINAANSTSNTFSNGEFYFPNYTSSNNKSISTDQVTENNSTAALTALTASIMANTSAITSIKFYPASSNFVQYSTAYLYGISNA